LSRVLHYFHVTHTRAETHLNATPTESWVFKEWEHTEKLIDSLDLSLGQTKIYQDSLPDLSNMGYETVDHTYPTETAIRYFEDLKH
jgi:hypothetical protein